MNGKEQNRTWFLRGMKDGVPIALGYFAVAFALGIAAKKAGMSAAQAGAMSALMLASAGQYAAITVIASGGGYIQMAVTTLIVNLRYLLMSCALSQKVAPGMKMRHRFLMSYPVTDEIFGIAMSVEGRLNPFYNYGAAAVAAPGWTAGAFLGAAAGAILPQRVENALSVALYGMFLAIIIPASRKNKVVAGIVAVSMLCSFLFTRLPVLREISSGMQIILLTVVIAGAAAYFFPVREMEENGGDENES
ncbi:MAG: AzlC family ABC transporter permease [Lachnospiraceae bacterium]|nr:AzlC family ABC transporter permease [Lachnospiraceae bacterium]